MKLFQKLAALTLAGIIALTFLTGCSEPEPRVAVDKTAEIVAVLNDSLHSYLTSSWSKDDDATAKEYKSDVKMNTASQKAAAVLSAKLSADEELAEMNAVDFRNRLEGEGLGEELRDVIVKNADDHERYYVFYVKNTAYTSGTFNSLKKYELAKYLRTIDNGLKVNAQADYDLMQDAVVLVGSAETKDGGYTAVVMKWPTKKFED